MITCLDNIDLTAERKRMRFIEILIGEVGLRSYLSVGISDASTSYNYLNQNANGQCNRRSS